MLKILYFDLNYLYPLQINFLIFWFFFFKFNARFNKEALIFDKKIFKQIIIEKKPVFFLFFLFFYFFFIFCLFFLNFQTIDQNFWWNHFYLTEINLNFFFFVIFFSFLFFKTLKIYFFQFNYYIYEYIFCIINLITFLPIFFFINNFFFFFIYLEFLTIFLFFLFVISRAWNLKNFSNWLQINYLYVKTLNISYVNLLFFQFWSSFFSSVFIVFSLLNFLNIFCSLEWSIINYLNIFYYFLYNNVYNYNIIFFFFCLIFAIFVKMGFTPIHFFKLEIYKGLTFLSIYYYTTFYFLFFFFF